jgi:hypothetical protein
MPVSMMNKLAFLAALLFALHASAENAARCGTDAFGNGVCIDKDGVLTNSPMKTVHPKVDEDKRNIRVESKEQTNTRTESNNGKSYVRCGIDSFGNKVCL